MPTEANAINASSAGAVVNSGTSFTSTPVLAGITDSGSPYNAAFGQSANSSDNGTNNVAVGYDALSSNSSGDYNTAIGYSAASGTTSGASNVCIGYNAGTSYTGSETGNICIGAGVAGTVGESDTLHIGDTGGGIQATYIAGIYQKNIPSGTYYDIYIGSGGICGTHSLSSIDYKENVTDMDEVSALGLRPVMFNYKDSEKKEKHYGLIAEEVAQTFPEMVLFKDGKPQGVSYRILPILLLNEIKKLRKEIDELKAAK